LQGPHFIFRFLKIAKTGAEEEVLQEALARGGAGICRNKLEGASAWEGPLNPSEKRACVRR
jgi:hypothetical protein